MRVAEQVAVVTGATSGLGEAIAKRMAEEGAKVAVVGRNQKRGEGVVAHIRQKGGVAEFFQADVTVEAEVEAMIEAVSRQFGKLDIVVNNAGVVIPGSVATVKKEEWDEVFAVNVTSTYLVSHYSLPHLIKQKSGSIINIASEAGLKGLANRAAYCAAKAAVVGMTKAMTVDHAADGVRVNCICPGTIETPMIKEMLAKHPQPEELMEQFLSRRVTPQLGTAEEIAEACVYFALPDNKYVTGAVLSIDGGALAK